MFVVDQETKTGSTSFDSVGRPVDRHLAGVAVAYVGIAGRRQSVKRRRISRVQVLCYKVSLLIKDILISNIISILISNSISVNTSRGLKVMGH